MTLKDIRLKKQLTQKQVAEQLNITPEYLSMIERGERKPSDELKEAMSNLYKKSISEIFLAIKETKCLQATNQNK